MKKKYMTLSLLFFILIAAMNLTSFTISMKDTNVDIEFKAQSDVPLAYIYDYNIDRANDFKSLLDLNGFSTTLINITDISSSSQLLPYNLIILGSDFKNYNLSQWFTLCIEDSGQRKINLIY